MLALATHEPDFRILREDPQEKRQARCSICHEFGHSSKVCVSKSNDYRMPGQFRLYEPDLAVPHDWTEIQQYSHEDWAPPRMLWFDVWVLREKLKPELHIPDITVNEKVIHVSDDLERQIDDFILLVVLCGNDFLPALALPNFEIHEGSISQIIKAWKNATRVSKGYIISQGTIRIDRLRALFKELALLEGEPPSREGKRDRPGLDSDAKYESRRT